MRIKCPNCHMKKCQVINYNTMLVKYCSECGFKEEVKDEEYVQSF